MKFRIPAYSILSLLLIGFFVSSCGTSDEERARREKMIDDEANERDAEYAKKANKDLEKYEAFLNDNEGKIDTIKTNLNLIYEKCTKDLNEENIIKTDDDVKLSTNCSDSFNGLIVDISQLMSGDDLTALYGDKLWFQDNELSMFHSFIINRPEELPANAEYCLLTVEKFLPTKFLAVFIEEEYIKPTFDKETYTDGSVSGRVAIFDLLSTDLIATYQVNATNNIKGNEFTVTDNYNGRQAKTKLDMNLESELVKSIKSENNKLVE